MYCTSRRIQWFYLAWDNSWAQVSKGVQAGTDTQQTTLWALVAGQAVPLVTAGNHQQTSKKVIKPPFLASQ